MDIQLQETFTTLNTHEQRTNLSMTHDSQDVKNTKRKLPAHLQSQTHQHNIRSLASNTKN